MGLVAEAIALMTGHSTNFFIMRFILSFVGLLIGLTVPVSAAYRHNPITTNTPAGMTNVISVVSSGALGTVRTNEANNLVLTGSTNNLGTDVSATKFWGDGSGLTGMAPLNTAVFSLAPTNYAVQGQEANIYFENIVRSSLPTDELAIDVTCNAGTHYQDFFRVTPTNTVSSNYSLTISVADFTTTNSLASYSGTLRVAANADGTNIVRKVLLIGDSTTAGGQTITEIVRKASTNLFKVTALGTQGTYTNKHEGHSGWTFANFYNTGASNPFTNGAVGATFDFNYFLTNNSYTMSANDWVIFNLGINDIFSYTSDATASAAATNFMGTYSNMFYSITNTVPGVRVGLCVLIPPSQSQDAFGDDYGSGQTQKRYRRNRYLLAETMLAYPLGTKIPINAALDTAHNMPTTAGVFNARNSDAWTYQSNGVHPDTSGYLQIADCLWAFLKGNEPWLTPTNLPGVTAKAWWVGTDLATNGSTLELADRSGNGFTLTNKSAAVYWPSRQAAAVNGIDALQFSDGTSTNYLRFDGMTQAQPYEFWCVMAYTNQPGLYVFKCTSGPGFFRNAPGIMAVYAGTYFQSVLALTNTFALWEASFNGTSSGIATNGVSGLIGDAGTSGLSGTIVIGANSNLSYPGNFSFLEGGIFSTNMNSTARAALRDYVKSKYNIP